MRSQCEKLHLINKKVPILIGLLAHNSRLKRPLISNTIIISINASERSELALGDISLIRLKLGARLMMRGKRGHLSKGIIHLLEKKRSTCQSTKGSYQR